MKYVIEIDEKKYAEFQRALSLTLENEAEVIKRGMEEFMENYISLAILKAFPSNPVSELQAIKLSSKGSEKVKRKIEKWARNYGQYNHKIIEAFFACEKNGKASKTEMQSYFEENKFGNGNDFYRNFISLCSDANKSNGKVFEYIADDVWIDEEIKDVVEKYKEYFISENKTEQMDKEETAGMEKNNFIEWLREETTLSEPTIKGYTGRLESALYKDYAGFSIIEPKNLFCITSIKELDKQIKKIEECKGYIIYEAQTHNGLRAAMRKYRKFLETIQINE